MMRPVGNHVHAAILRAIAAQAGLDTNDREKPILIVEQIKSVDWASATFIGARHEFDLRISGDPQAVESAKCQLMAGLADREIPIAGQIVAEIAVALVAEDKRNLNMTTITLRVNALTILD
jgi:hypothetical protein